MALLDVDRRLQALEAFDIGSTTPAMAPTVTRTPYAPSSSQSSNPAVPDRTANRLAWLRALRQEPLPPLLRNRQVLSLVSRDPITTVSSTRHALPSFRSRPRAYRPEGGGGLDVRGANQDLATTSSSTLDHAGGMTANRAANGDDEIVGERRRQRHAWVRLDANGDEILSGIEGDEEAPPPRGWQYSSNNPDEKSSRARSSLGGTAVSSRRPTPQPRRVQLAVHSLADDKRPDEVPLTY